MNFTKSVIIAFTKSAGTSTNKRFPGANLEQILKLVRLNRKRAFLQRGFFENTIELYSYDDDNKWDEDVEDLVSELWGIKTVTFVQ